MNPLQKYYRQPKLFISLPSKGMFYSAGVLQGDPNNVPIFAMTGMDEILMKTPDALFSGTATVKLIESCCPYIKDASRIPTLDLDALLVAIRMATFGENMTVAHVCSNCSEENEFEIKLPYVLDQYSTKTFKNKLELDELTVNFKPLTYSELSKFNIENFKLQKTLGQLKEVPVEEQQQHLDLVYQRLGEIQAELFMDSIESVRTPEALVTDKEFIREWLANTIRDSYAKIKSHLETIKEEWQLPKFPIKCTSCGHDESIEITMDQSNFFD